MKKYLLLALALAINIYFRAFPAYFPQLKIEARARVGQGMRQEAIKEIDQKFPGFSNWSKSSLIQALINQKKQQKQAIEAEVQKEYLKLKNRYQDEAGQTYLMELDGWHWGRYVENILRSGHPGDEVINGRQRDNLMIAPLGDDLYPNHFLFYLSAFLYKIFSLFSPVPLFTFLFYLPLFFTAVFIVVLYMFSYRHSGSLGALITCLFVGLTPVFLTRSCAGWFDTDPLNLLFPILVVWTYILAYDAPTFRRRILWICFSSFWLGLFCFTWQSWWFIFLIIIMYEIYSLLNVISVHWQYKEKNLFLFKQHIISLSLFIVLGLFWVILFAGFQPILSLYSKLSEALTLNRSLAVSIWPNVFSTVGELEKMTMPQIIRTSGGLFIFLSSLFYVLILFLRTRKSQRYTDFTRECVVILIFWFFSMFFACFKGVRFIIFLVIPTGIFLGWLINDAYRYFINTKKRLKACLLLMIAIILSNTFIDRAYKTMYGTFPMMNDSWHKVLSSLRKTTPREAIINSWWDFGDWFKVAARRRVIFDGQSQNLPQAYWMANVLIADNEEKAVGILRMLNNAGNKAFESINEYLKDPLKSVLLLERIIPSKTPEAAKGTLLEFLPGPVAEQVIRLLFNKPDKAYFIVEYTMQSKISTISYLGNWDFSKVYLAQNFNKNDQSQVIGYLTKFGLDNQEIQRFSQEVGLIPKVNLDGWISYRAAFHGRLVKGEEKNNIVLFNNGLVYSPKEQTIYLYALEEGRYGKYRIPRSLFIVRQDKIEEIGFANNDLDFSVLMFKNQEGYQAILLDRQLANSLFVRLYFLGGAGLKHFKPFIEEKDGEDYIRVFEIAWD